MDIWKVNEFNFLCEKVVEFMSRWRQSMTDGRNPSCLKEKKIQILFMRHKQIIHSIFISTWWCVVSVSKTYDVSQHGWRTKKILGFEWSKKAKTTLETISFWRNISIIIFKFYAFLYIMKACQWNLISVINITQTDFTEKMCIHDT